MRCFTLIQFVLFLVLSLTMCNGTYAATVHLPGLTVSDYYSYTPVVSNSGTNDIAIGNGGFFGNDLYIAEFGTFTGGDGNGRVLRVTDSNNDGVGEGSVLVSAVGTPFRSPASLAFGPGGGSPYGNDLYFLDYSGSTSSRFVYRVPNTGPSPSASQFSTTAVFNPEGMQFSHDGNRLLLNNAHTFTTFGGGDDATVFQISPTGAVSTWADGSNNTNGLWDINNQGATSPDGWYTFSNHSVNPGNQREIVQFKDLNNDGDANDAGESRVIIGLGAPIGQQAGFAFDTMGRFYHSSGTVLHQYTDLNNDNDFWNSATNDFDTGERILLADDFGGNIRAMDFAPNGDMFIATNPAGSVRSIFRITGLGVPEPSSVLILCVALLGLIGMRSRQ